MNFVQDPTPTEYGLDLNRPTAEIRFRVNRYDLYEAFRAVDTAGVKEFDVAIEPSEIVLMSRRATLRSESRARIQDCDLNDRDRRKVIVVDGALFRDLLCSRAIYDFALSTCRRTPDEDFHIALCPQRTSPTGARAQQTPIDLHIAYGSTKIRWDATGTSLAPSAPLLPIAPDVPRTRESSGKDEGGIATSGAAGCGTDQADVSSDDLLDDGSDPGGRPSRHVGDPRDREYCSIKVTDLVRAIRSVRRWAEKGRNPTFENIEIAGGAAWALGDRGACCYLSASLAPLKLQLSARDASELSRLLRPGGGTANVYEAEHRYEIRGPKWRHVVQKSGPSASFDKISGMYTDPQFEVSAEILLEALSIIVGQGASDAPVTISPVGDDVHGQSIMLSTAVEGGYATYSFSVNQLAGAGPSAPSITVDKDLLKLVLDAAVVGNMSLAVTGRCLGLYTTVEGCEIRRYVMRRREAAPSARRLSLRAQSPLP